MQTHLIRVASAPFVLSPKMQQLVQRLRQLLRVRATVSAVSGDALRFWDGGGLGELTDHA